MDYILHILVIVGIYGILALSLDIIVGYTGIPALGHAAFSLVGAYTSSLLALQLGVSPWLGMLAGAVLASLVGAIVAYPAVRLKGDYLALATLGLGIIAYVVAKNWVSLTQGPIGLPGIPTISFWGFKFRKAWHYLALVWGVLGIVYWLSWLITNRPFGRVLRGIREDEIATQSLGKNIWIVKTKIFMTGAFLGGIAGALYAHYMTYIDPSSFTLMESIIILLMVILGGMGTLHGSVLGAFLVIAIPESFRFFGLPSSIAAHLRQMLYGLVLVILMILCPKGIMGKYKWK